MKSEPVATREDVTAVTNGIFLPAKIGTVHAGLLAIRALLGDA